MSLFLSTYINKIDAKGRVSLPAAFRSTLALSGQEGLVLFKSYTHPALEGCTYARMSQLSHSLDHMDLFSTAHDSLASTLFADALHLTWDQDGRILLPRGFLEHARLEDQIAFVGRGATFQLWAPGIFQNHQEQAREHIKNKGLTLRIDNSSDSCKEPRP